MKTPSLITVAFLSLAIGSFAQDTVKERIGTIKLFVQDLQGDMSNADVFKKYLRSGGTFESEKTGEAANAWTDVLRNSLKASTVDNIGIYKYSERPEKGRKLKAIEDPNSDDIEYESLEFELRAKNNTVSDVDHDNLYVIGIGDERIFVLFGQGNKMITCFGLKWGQKVELTEF